MGNVVLIVLPARMGFAVPVFAVEGQGAFGQQKLELAAQSRGKF